MQKSAKKAVKIMSRPKVYGEGKQNAADLQKQTMHDPNHFTELFDTDCSIQNIIDPVHQSSHGQGLAVLSHEYEGDLLHRYDIPALQHYSSHSTMRDHELNPVQKRCRDPVL
jgi:hypothetical protein